MNSEALHVLMFFAEILFELYDPKVWLHRGDGVGALFFYGKNIHKISQEMDLVGFLSQEMGHWCLKKPFMKIVICSFF